MARSPEPPCAVCSRPARGFGWSEPERVNRPRPSVWFCSIACQAFFWERARRSSAVVDLTDEEKAAIGMAVKGVSEIMQEIGWHVRFGELTEPQVLILIEAAVGGFQDAMRDIAVTHRQSSEVPF